MTHKDPREADTASLNDSGDGHRQRSATAGSTYSPTAGAARAASRFSVLWKRLERECQSRPPVALGLACAVGFTLGTLLGARLVRIAFYACAPYAAREVLIRSELAAKLRAQLRDLLREPEPQPAPFG